MVIIRDTFLRPKLYSKLFYTLKKKICSVYFVLILFFFFEEYGCLTMSCWFLLYGKVNQLHVYVYPLLGGFPSHLDHHRALSRVPCAVE